MTGHEFWCASDERMVPTNHNHMKSMALKLILQNSYAIPVIVAVVVLVVAVVILIKHMTCVSFCVFVLLLIVGLVLEWRWDGVGIASRLDRDGMIVKLLCADFGIMKNNVGIVCGLFWVALGSCLRSFRTVVCAMFGLLCGMVLGRVWNRLGIDSLCISCHATPDQPPRAATMSSH